ncbi:MAG: DUF1887 family protein [Candidatus Heimdallarchaeota archaeon]|nr:DUF1887 family protein [Candidatus Heimdallarchaeota archaeon]
MTLEIVSSMRSPDVLITLLGSNPLVPVTAIKFLSTKDTKNYILHTEGTSDIVLRIKKWGNDKYEIEGIELEPFNMGSIATNLQELLTEKKLKGLIHLDTTGGTKPMLLGTFLSLQKIVNEETELVTSYIINFPWELSVTNINDLSTTNFPISLKFSINEIISLHQNQYRLRNPRNIKVQSDLSKQIGLIVSKSNSSIKWRRWKKNNLDQCFKNNGKAKPKNELSKLQISFDDFSSLSNLIHPKTNNINLDDLTTLLKFKNTRHLVDWLNGFWLETYVASVFEEEPLKSIIDDVKVNVETQNPQFELDLIFLVKNQVYVLSISTTTDVHQGGKSTLKKKIFEVIIRSRQIAGWKSKFGLVCMSENPEELEKEVEDYLIDRNVKVFGVSDLANLRDNISKWVNN